jgi:hypothetical protein
LVRVKVGGTGVPVGVFVRVNVGGTGVFVGVLVRVTVLVGVVTQSLSDVDRKSPWSRWAGTAFSFTSMKMYEPAGRRGRLLKTGEHDEAADDGGRECEDEWSVHYYSCLCVNQAPIWLVDASGVAACV